MDRFGLYILRDYYLADSIVDKVDATHSLESEIILFLDKEKNSSTVIDHESTTVNIKLILEDIRSAEAI